LGTFKSSGFPTETFGNDRLFGFLVLTYPPLRLLDLAALVAQIQAPEGQTIWGGIFWLLIFAAKKSNSPAVRIPLS